MELTLTHPTTTLLAAVQSEGAGLTLRLAAAQLEHKCAKGVYVLEITRVLADRPWDMRPSGQSVKDVTVEARGLRFELGDLQVLAVAEMSDGAAALVLAEGSFDAEVDHTSHKQLLGLVESADPLTELAAVGDLVAAVVSTDRFTHMPRAEAIAEFASPALAGNHDGFDQPFVVGPAPATSADRLALADAQAVLARRLQAHADEEALHGELPQKMKESVKKVEKALGALPALKATGGMLSEGLDLAGKQCTLSGTAAKPKIILAAARGTNADGGSLHPAAAVEYVARYVRRCAQVRRAARLLAQAHSRGRLKPALAAHYGLK